MRRLPWIAPALLWPPLIPAMAAETVVQEQVTVSATLLTDAPSEQPYAFYRHDRAALDDQVGRSALDRINYGPGLFIQQTAPAQASPFIRGLTGEQTLLLLDGVRLSHATMRPGPNQYAAMVPDMSIASIDAVLGSSAAATGSDGLTGALDFRLEEAGRGVDGGASPWLRTRVDHANGMQSATGVDGKAGAWRYSAEAGLTRYHDRIGGKDAEDNLFAQTHDDHGIPNTAYREQDYATRLAYDGIDHHSLSFAAGHTGMLDAPRPDGYFANSGVTANISRSYDPQSFTYAHLRDRYRPDAGSWFSAAETTLWFHDHDEHQIRERATGPGYRREIMDDGTLGAGANLMLENCIGKSHRLSYGLNLAHEWTANAYERWEGASADAAVRVQRDRDGQRTTIPDDSTYDTAAAFLQDRWFLAEDWDLLTGLRFSYYRWESEVDGRTGFTGTEEIDGNTSDCSGSVRLSWRLHERMLVFAGAGRSFRAPNLTNLTGLSDRASSSIVTHGNPDLDPEVSYTAELGWRYQSGKDDISLTLFHTWIRDLIQPVYQDTNGDGVINAGDSGRMENAEGAVLRGGELAWDLDVLAWAGTPGRTSLVGAASLVDGTVDLTRADGSVDRDNLSRANRLYGWVGIQYQTDSGWWIRPQLRWHDTYDEPAESDAQDLRMTVAGDPDGSMPGYAVFDLALGWHTPDRNRFVTATVENIADHSYREVGSGTDAPGFNLSLAAGARF